MPEKPVGQDIMNDGPGLRQRTRETNAAIGAVAPELPKATPPQVNPNGLHKPSKKDQYGSRPGEERWDVSQFTKPLGSFKSGTDYVPKTGNYQLHEGEKVVPKGQNMDAMALVPGRSEEKPKKVIHEIRSRKAKDGSVIHEHHHTHPEHHKMEEHTSASPDAAGAHVAEMLGGSPAPVAPPDAGAAGAPPAGAPAGAPPAPGM